MERRPGDVVTTYADAGNAWRALRWKAELGIDDMVRDAWRFEANNRK